MDPLHRQPHHRLCPLRRLLRLWLRLSRPAAAGPTPVRVAEHDCRRCGAAVTGEGADQVHNVVLFYVSQFQRGEAFGMGYGEAVYESASYKDRVDCCGVECGDGWVFDFRDVDYT